MGNWRAIKAISLALALAFISVHLLELTMAEGKAQWPMSYYDEGNTNSCPYDAAGNDGQLLWSYHLTDVNGMHEGSISRPVIGDDGILYYHTTNRLLALSEDGEKLWENLIPYSLAPLPAAIGNDGCIYYATGSMGTYYWNSEGGLYAVWPNGTMRWSDTLSAPVMTAPRIDGQGNVLIVAAQWLNADSLGFFRLCCYGEEGDIRWTFSPDSANRCVFSEPAISSSGTIYLLTYMLNNNATLWAIDPNGNELWNKNIPASNITEGVGASSDLRISVDLDESLYLTIGTMLLALDPGGQELWNYSGINGQLGVAIGEDHLFVVNGSDMNILNKDGAWIATYFAGDERRFHTTPTVVQGDNVILTPWFGDVQIVNATGVRVWSYPLNDASSDSVLVDDQGRIYIVVNDYEWASTPSIIAVGDRSLQTNIVVWDIMWGLSILFCSVMLVLFLYPIRRNRKSDGGGKLNRRGKENQRQGNIVRIIGCLLMLVGFVLGMWALYGPNLENYGLLEIFDETGLQLAVMMGGAYILLITMCAINAKWGIAQFVVLTLITAVMLLGDPLQTVQGDLNDGWVPQIGFVMAWLGTGLVLLSGRYYTPGLTEEEPSLSP